MNKVVNSERTKAKNQELPSALELAFTRQVNEWRRWRQTGFKNRQLINGRGK